MPEIFFIVRALSSGSDNCRIRPELITRAVLARPNRTIYRAGRRTFRVPQGFDATVNFYFTEKQQLGKFRMMGATDDGFYMGVGGCFGWEWMRIGNRRIGKLFNASCKRKGFFIRNTVFAVAIKDDLMFVPRFIPSRKFRTLRFYWTGNFYFLSCYKTTLRQ